MIIGPGHITLPLTHRGRQELSGLCRNRTELTHSGLTQPSAVQAPDHPDAPALHDAKISYQGQSGAQYQAAYPGNQIGMPESVPHRHDADITMKYLMNIMIMNGDGRCDA